MSSVFFALKGLTKGFYGISEVVLKLVKQELEPTFPFILTFILKSPAITIFFKSRHACPKGILYSVELIVPEIFKILKNEH